MSDDATDFMLWEFERTGDEFYLRLAYGTQDINPDNFEPYGEPVEEGTSE